MRFQDHLGEIAALAAALCWVFTSLAFAAAGRRIGPTAVNVTRIFLALVVLAVINRLLFGAWMPRMETRQLILLAVSGFVGLAVGDQCHFTALVDVGPRLALLMATIAPPVTAAVAWPVLHEALGWSQWLGILVTMAGVVWVVLERPPGAGEPDAGAPRPHRVRGIVLGLAGGVCQALGLVLSKLGMGHGAADPTASEMVDPWTATLCRMAAAAVGVLLVAGVLRRSAARRATNVINAESGHLPPAEPRQRQLRFALAMVLIGVVFGPVLGVWGSMLAVDRAEAGIAATLMAMSPVFVLPFSVWLEKEPVSWRAAAGAVIAVAGVGLLTAT